MRNVPASVLPNLLAAETSEAYIVLLDIVGDSGTLYVCNDAQAVVLGNTYQSYPFSITLPAEVEGNPSTATLTLDNVSRQLIDDVRSQESRLVVTITVIQASNQAVVATFPDFDARDVKYDALSISMTLTLENFLQEPFPKDLFSMKNFAGLF